MSSQETWLKPIPGAKFPAQQAPSLSSQDNTSMLAGCRNVRLAAHLTAAAIFIGYGKADTDLISAMCSDATAKCVEATDLVHEHLEEIQDTCKTEPEPKVKPCEDGKVAGIDAAEENVTAFYNKHCVDHVTEWLGKDDKTLENVHKYADKFETTHKAEIEKELHEGIHRGIKDGKPGEKTLLQIVCTHEVEKEVERDGGLVHDHLKEVEAGCKGKDDVAKCETVAAGGLIAAKDKTIASYIEHCSKPTTWSLWAIHPAVDNFAAVHKKEMKHALHEKIHGAMAASGLESATAAFSLQPAPVAPVPSQFSGAASAQLVMGVTGLVAGLGAMGFGVVRLVRPRALPWSEEPIAPLQQDGRDIEELQAVLHEQ
uniref:Uncharacterized protein n=1 Tax=Pyrodinium bahamense TaxID=73915 RepID=A0A7S0AQ84_9DINO